MRQALIISALLLLGIGFGTNASAQTFALDKNRPVVYQSFGNSVGEIVLLLEPEGKFKVWYKSYADKKNFKLQGKWSKKGKDYKLTFKGKKANFYQLFPKAARTKSFKIVDGNTVKFNSEDNGLFIWGVFCTKQ